MNIDFNAGKKINKISDDEGKEEIIEEENSEITEDEPQQSSNKNYDKDEMKKRLVKVFGIIMIIFVVILLIILLTSLFIKKNYTYDDVELEMKNAAMAYFNDNQHQLPKEGNTVTIGVDNLVDANYMDSLDTYLGKETTCTGRVDVENINNTYAYNPYLNCGNDYETIELYKKVTNKVITNGYGLYSQKGEFVYRGETVNNYVKLNNALWRIVKVKSDNSMELILANASAITNCFDDRYNRNVEYASGINNYSTSRIKELLNSLYDGSGKVEGYDPKDYHFVNKEDKTKLLPMTVCVGKRAENDTSKDGSVECSETLRNQYLSLLPLSDYITASLDNDCTTTTSKSCGNFNYLVDESDWWLITADKSNTSNAYLVDANGGVNSELSNYYAGIRPVIYLKSNTFYKSGNGTKSKPYKVK